MISECQLFIPTVIGRGSPARTPLALSGWRGVQANGDYRIAEHLAASPLSSFGKSVAAGPSGLQPVATLLARIHETPEPNMTARLGYSGTGVCCLLARRRSESRYGDAQNAHSFGLEVFWPESRLHALSALKSQMSAITPDA